MRTGDALAHLGRMAMVLPLCDLDISVSVEYRRAKGAGFELLLWIGPSHGTQYLAAGEFWTEWTLGEAFWVRFRHEVSVFNRATFAAVEVRPARDPAQRPQGVLWLPSTPPSPPSRATA